ncbi:MAG: histidine phosphatase family protein, partial [Pseudomonadota bacterium]
MTRELLILRHGKSDWEAGTDDFHRPLKDRGKRAAQRMAVHLQQRDLLPDHVLSSPAERAVETARKACKAMGLTAGDVHTDGRIYAAGPESLIEALGDSPADARRVLLVGHNPGLEELLGYLAETTPPLPPDGKLLPTATLARLEMPDDWRALQPGCGRLVELVRPGGLPKKFPFPAPDGPELRDRPAYYYIQSSVIPYRLNDGRLEILIIASSKNKHSVVPKGIQDPGHTPQ